MEVFIHARVITEKVRSEEMRLSGDVVCGALVQRLILHFGLFLVRFRCYIYLIWALGRLFEVAYSLSNALSNLWQFACPEYDEDDDQDNKQLGHSNTKHIFPLFLLNQQR